MGGGTCSDATHLLVHLNTILGMESSHLGQVLARKLLSLLNLTSLVAINLQRQAQEAPW
jgi:hypothetical protein